MCVCATVHVNVNVYICRKNTYREGLFRSTYRGRMLFLPFSLSLFLSCTHIQCIQGHLKKRKLESGKAQPAKSKESQSAKGGKGGKKTRKSVEDEVDEESKLFCS